jgi:dihydrofolate reductase
MASAKPDGDKIRKTIIAAVAKNGVIGADNRLLWRLKSDMRHFRTLTMGKVLIMGRKTYDSIGKPLPGRHTVVITRDRGLVIEGVRVVHSLADALAAGAEIARETGTDEIFIGGGGEIYAAAIGLADRLEITAVALEPEGDAHFPSIDLALWREEKRASFTKSMDDEAAFDFISYGRR